MLNAVSAAASGGDRLPTWLSTHPNPVDRGDRILELIDALPRPPERTALLNIPGGHRARGSKDMFFQTYHGYPIVGG